MSSEPSRRVAMAPFTLLGVAAIVAGGILAARISAQPWPTVVWLVAYLVLVVGVAQYALGLGQARLAARAPSLLFIALEWFVFNLGNAGVIAGTLAGHFHWVVAGSILVIIAMLAFAWGALGNRHHLLWRVGYYALVALIFASALVGLVLSFNHSGI